MTSGSVASVAQPRRPGRSERTVSQASGTAIAIAPAVTAPARPRLRTTRPSERVVKTASAATERSPTTTTTRYSAGSAAASATAAPSANSSGGGRRAPSQRAAPRGRWSRAARRRRDRAGDVQPGRVDARRHAGARQSAPVSRMRSSVPLRSPRLARSMSGDGISSSGVSSFEGWTPADSGYSFELSAKYS